MTDQRDQKTNDSYWRYLEENSKVVSTWPDWLKGDRTSTVQTPSEKPVDKDHGKIAS